MAKEKARILKQTKTHVMSEVPAYSDGKLVGWAKVTTFQPNEAGLAAAKASLTLPDVGDLNRQKFTDAKNNLRRGTSDLATLRQVAKTNPEVDRAVKLLVKRAEGAALTPEEIKFMESLLK